MRDRLDMPALVSVRQCEVEMRLAVIAIDADRFRVSLDRIVPPRELGIRASQVVMSGRGARVQSDRRFEFSRCCLPASEVAVARTECDMRIYPVRLKTNGCAQRVDRFLFPPKLAVRDAKRDGRVDTAARWPGRKSERSSRIRP